MEKRQRGRRLTGYVPNYVVFDLETTGLSPTADEIIELSAIKVKNQKAVQTFSTLAKPSRPIPPGATAINGITDKMVAHSPSVSEVVKNFLDFAGNEVLVGHNIHSFDLNFLCNAVWKYWNREVTNDYIDTLFMARKCLPQLPHHRLVDLAAYFHFSTKGAHRALNDCWMNQKCFEEMAKLQKASSAPEPSPYCPRCKGILQKRNGRYGAFYGCSNFPSCRYTKDC